MTKWFGQQWPSPEMPAPVCDNLKDQVPIPIGQTCPVCHGGFADGDQGITTPYVGMDVVGEISYHLRCFWREVGILDLIEPRMKPRMGTKPDAG